MKAMSILRLVLLMGVFSVLGILYTADARQTASDPNRVAGPDSTVTIPRSVRQAATTEGRSGQVPGREQVRQQTAERRATEHAAEIAGLEAIKKIAQEENAVRTVAAVQKLIDEKNAAFKQSQDQAERQRRARMEQIQERTQEPRPADNKPDAPQN